MELNAPNLCAAQWLRRALGTGTQLRYLSSTSESSPQIQKTLPPRLKHALSETNCTDTRLVQGWSVKKSQALVASDNSPFMPRSLLMQPQVLPSNPGLLHYERC